MTERMRQTERDDISHIVAQHRYGTFKENMEMKFNISELITNIVRSENTDMKVIIPCHTLSPLFCQIMN